MSAMTPLNRRLRAELILLLIAIVLGLVLVPVGIFFTGQLTLGPYRDEAGLLTFLGDFFTDLGRGHFGAWTLAAGPLLLILLLRGIGWVWRRGRIAREAADA